MPDPKNTYLLECCVDSIASAIQAEKGGAHRLELCSNLIIGGTTPGMALFRQVKQHVGLPVHVLVRPRFGDFLYSHAELEQIAMEIDMFREAGAEGIVIGCLRPDGSLDVKAMEQLMQHAGPMKVTLHRAFDMCCDPFRTMEEAIALGIHTILTSGCRPSSLQGIDLLGQLSERAGKRISVMAGAGIDESTVQLLLARTSITDFHMSGKRSLESGMQFRNPQVSMGLPGMSEYEIWETDARALAAVKKLFP